LADILRQQNFYALLERETPEQTHERLRTHLKASHPDNATILVAEVEGKILGYGAVRWMHNLVLSGPDAYLSELFVLPEVRGLGIGSRILAGLRKEARRRNAPRIWCMNLRTRDAFQLGYYSKHGWDEKDTAVFMSALESATESSN
jgi:GNAT superfamily N-acetyltransferase